MSEPAGSGAALLALEAAVEILRIAQDDMVSCWLWRIVQSQYSAQR
jgi:hypothetical protein